MLDDHNLSIPGYSVIQAGHPDDVKRGGFCLYFTRKFNFKSDQQLISDPTHLLPNSSSCTDLTFTDQPNLAVNSGVHHSLDVTCHHQTILCKFNLMTVHPPPYEHLVWDYKKANTDAIIYSINQVVGNFFFSIRMFTSKFTYLTKY